MDENYKIYNTDTFGIGREFIGIELNEVYFEPSKQRLEEKVNATAD